MEAKYIGKVKSGKYTELAYEYKGEIYIVVDYGWSGYMNAETLKAQHEREQKIIDGIVSRKTDIDEPKPWNNEDLDLAWDMVCNPEKYM